MNTATLKKAAVSAVTFSALAMPVMALAVTSGDLQSMVGLDYATAVGLGTQDVRTTVGSIIKAFMGMLGVVAVVIILLGGFKWMTAGGSEDKVAEAKKLILQGIIGLVIIMSAYAIANFVIGAVISGTSDTA